MSAPPSTTTQRSTSRLTWIDRLKVVTIAGVVIAHAGTAYVVDIGWYFEERTTSQVTPALLGVPLVLAAVFGLAPLFLVGGWLAAQSLDRRGVLAFTRARLLRLGLPALLFFLVVDPLADFLGGWVQGETRTLASYLGDLGGDRDLGPVWFITALLAFSLAYAAWRRARPAVRRQEGLRPGVLVVTALGIALTDVLTWLHWPYFSETLWNLNWQHWPQAAGLFALGAAAWERGWLTSVPQRIAYRCGILAVGGAVAFMGLAGYGFVTEDQSIAGGLRPTALVFAVVDGLCAVALSVWVWAWFRRRWDGPPRPALARASRGAYAAYLLHPLVLVALSAALWPLPWVPELKFVVVAALGVPAVFAVGYLVTRLPGVSRVL